MADSEFVLEPTSGADDVLGFAVTQDGQRIGTVALLSVPTRRNEPATWQLRWNLAELDPHSISRLLGEAMQHLFALDSTARIEARVHGEDAGSARAASIAGLRREGVVRGPGGNDHVQFARLAEDEPPHERNGFIAILNAGLPRKRVIGQGVLRDEKGRVLLCELTYKREWDLPGGVIENGESPAFGLQRELAEELGHEFAIGELITMNWLPAWRAWDDACVFVFDIGQMAAEDAAELVLQPSEIKAVHWCDEDTVREHATAATIELLEAMTSGAVSAYREAPKADE